MFSFSVYLETFECFEGSDDFRVVVFVECAFE